MNSEMVSGRNYGQALIISSQEKYIPTFENTWEQLGGDLEKKIQGFKFHR